SARSPARRPGVRDRGLEIIGASATLADPLAALRPGSRRGSRSGGGMASKPERAAVLQAVLGCGENAASRLARLAVWTSADRSQILLHQGDRHAQCHLVVSGSADIRVLGREGQYIQIATVEPGEIFGAYPEPSVARADVRAQVAMELVSLETERLA